MRGDRVVYIDGVQQAAVPSICSMVLAHRSYISARNLWRTFTDIDFPTREDTEGSLLLPGGEMLGYPSLVAAV